jgi:hypothetical protein
MRRRAKRSFRLRRQKVEFKGPYLFAMREQDPKMFMELRRSGKLDAHLQEKSEEAHRLLEELLASKPKNKWGNYSPADEREAEELVRSQLIEFPTPEKDQRPEPPDDLPTDRTQASRDRTSASSRAT